MNRWSLKFYVFLCFLFFFEKKKNRYLSKNALIAAYETVASSHISCPDFQSCYS